MEEFAPAHGYPTRRLAMPTPRVYRTVQTRILEYDVVIGLTVVCREEAETSWSWERFRGNIENQKNTTLWAEVDF